MTVIEQLEAIIRERKSASGEKSYTASLLQQPDKMLKKIGEEATEVVIAGKNQNREEIIYESADLIFHLLVLLGRENIPFSAVENELAKRFGVSGHEEKAQRKE